MSIKTQKIIRFIPVVSLITVFCWFAIYIKKGIDLKHIFKNLFLLFGAVILVTIPRILVYELCNNQAVVNIVQYLFLYIQMFVMAHIAVRAQEKYIAEKEQL